MPWILSEEEFYSKFINHSYFCHKFDIRIAYANGKGVIDMRIRKGYIIFGVICTLAVCSFSGCQKADDAQTTPAVETQTPAVTETPVASQETKNPEQNTEKKEISIYTINDDTLESEPVIVEVEEELTAEAVVKASVKSLEEHSLKIGIYSVVQEGDAVIVSFQKDTAPVVGVGSGVEETILNCISDSLIDNVEGCKKVIFRVEDGPYESGHMIFGIDEVYASE